MSVFYPTLIRTALQAPLAVDVWFREINGFQNLSDDMHFRHQKALNATNLTSISIAYYFLYTLSFNYFSCWYILYFFRKFFILKFIIFLIKFLKLILQHVLFM